MVAPCAKVLLTLINFILWLIGCGFIGGAVYILTSEPGTLPYAELELIAGTDIVCYICIGFGAFLFILGFLGCVGALKESHGMLKMYMGILSSLFMAEIGAAVFVWLMEDMVVTYIQMAWSFLDEITINLVQSQLHCCGFLNYTEYSNSLTNISLSCYENENATAALYDIGCYDKFVDYVMENVEMSAIAGGSLVLFEIIGILCSCYMMKAIDKQNKVEPMSEKRRRRSRDSFHDDRRGRRDQRAWDI